MDPRQRRAITLMGVLVVAALGNWLLAGQSTDPIDSYIECATAGYPTTSTNPQTCSDGEHVFLGPYASPSPSSSPLISVLFTLLVDGDSGSNYPRSQQLITTQADWVHYWSQVHAALPSLPPLLPVDFSQNNVVALSEGVEQTSGYNLKITGISTGAAGTNVAFTRQVPSITCPVQDTKTNRYLIVETPKLTLPVSFTMTSEPRLC